MQPDLPIDEEGSQTALLPGMPEAGVHAELYRLWHSKCRDGRLPGRRDFDPLEMPQLLPHLTLFDVERDPLRFRIRLVGTAIVAAMGRDTTGLYLDQLERIESVAERAHQLTLDKSPFYQAGRPLTWTHRDYRTYSVLGLPLAGDGATVDMLLYSMIFA